MKFKVHFENHRAIIDQALVQAKTEVMIAVAWINFKEYFDIFEQLLDRNVKLHIVCSDNWANRSHQAEIDRLIQKKARIKLLKMPSDRNHMHHKFAVIDRDTIINGSFNWSPNATRSFENILVIEDCAPQANEFIAEFRKLWLVKMESIRALQKSTNANKKAVRAKPLTSWSSVTAPPSILSLPATLSMFAIAVTNSIPLNPTSSIPS